MRILIIKEKDNCKKLNTVLLNEFCGLSINTLYKALRMKDIRINNIRICKNVIVHTGDEIKVFITDDLLFKDASTSIHIEKDNILYEDSNVIIFNKPSEIEVLGKDSLTEYLSLYLGYPVYPCHRLDRNTTGVILFAKNEEALNILLNKFKTHEIEKHYICTVVGIPKNSSAILTAYLFKDTKKSMVYISDSPQKGYQKIITEYSIISSNALQNTSTLDVTLHTGKTHQIRAHLAHIGYPIVGDGKYGVNSINKKLGYKTQQLCSYSIEFKFTSDSGMLNYLNGKKISR